MTGIASPNVWAERAAERKKDGPVSNNGAFDNNAGSKSTGTPSLVGTSVPPEDPADVIENKVEVMQNSVGFIVGPKVSHLKPCIPEITCRAFMIVAPQHH